MMVFFNVDPPSVPAPTSTPVTGIKPYYSFVSN